MITIGNTPLEQGALNILAALEARGFQAFLVGGYVRDKLIGRSVHDIDIATSALPEEVIGIFEHTIPTGLQHGTVTVMLDHTPFEVTTFRTEGTYSDRRHPDDVHFVTDVESDLSRRDFTINAMALDRNGTLIDPYDGHKDLIDRKLRCVGNASERFGEDALRMVRAIRFAAEYELTIVESSWQAILMERSRLVHVAMERIRAELERMIAGSSPERALMMWCRSELFDYLKRDLGISSAQWSRLPKHLSEISRLQERWTRWCWLWLRLELDPSAASMAMKRLTFSKHDRKLVETYLHIVYHVIQWSAEWDVIGGRSDQTERLALLWKKNVLMVGQQACIQILHLLSALHHDQLAPLMKLLQKHAISWGEEMPLHHLSELAIRGDDVLEIVHRKGPWIKETLDRLLEEAAIHGLPNERGALLDRAKQLLNKWDPEHIKAMLQPSSRLVTDIRCYQSIDSTQAEASRWLAQQDQAEGGLVLAEQQLAGRGRQGKSWFSPEGKGIWLSLILRPRVPSKYHPQLTLLVSVAICRVLRSMGVQAGIKWPNDILANGKKLAGILLESSQGKDGYRYIICGVGISVNITIDEYPESIQDVVTSVLEELGIAVDRMDILIRFLRELEELLELYEKAGFQAIKSMWEALSVTIGQKIRITGDDKTYMVLGLSDDGALQVNDENNQVQYIHSGEINHLNSSEKI